MGNKKIIAAGVILGVMLCASAFAQETGPQINFTGLGKSGVLWTKTEEAGKKDGTKEEVKLGSKDDAGIYEGRFRLDLDFVNKNLGMKTRMEWDNWSGNLPPWVYAFAYGNFFNDQLTVSVGKLGASPWGTGGPEMWKELENARGGGMRVEYKPKIDAVPLLNGLNIGFILNSSNDGKDGGWPADKELTLMEILRESVIGFSYTHDWFLVRFAYRFDGEYDKITDRRVDVGAGEVADGEDSLLFRVEERVLKNFLPGLQVWAMGYYNALYVEDKSCQLLQNWLFVQYDPEDFTAQVRLGLDIGDERTLFYVRPSFYWKFFGNLVNVGALFSYAQDYGNKQMHEGSPFFYLEAEPRIQVNFGSSYVAFAYNWRLEYLKEMDYHRAAGVQPIKQTQWMNLRFCIQLL